MPFDIYGHVLRDGYCEVHPNVHETYPCAMCLQQSGHPLVAALRPGPDVVAALARVHRYLDVREAQDYVEIDADLIHAIGTIAGVEELRITDLRLIVGEVERHSSGPLTAGDDPPGVPT
jgi:hypothetical protein